MEENLPHEYIGLIRAVFQDISEQREVGFGVPGRESADSAIYENQPRQAARPGWIDLGRRFGQGHRPRGQHDGREAQLIDKGFDIARAGRREKAVAGL